MYEPQGRVPGIPSTVGAVTAGLELGLTATSDPGAGVRIASATRLIARPVPPTMSARRSIRPIVYLDFFLSASLRIKSLNRVLVSKPRSSCSLTQAALASGLNRGVV